MPIPINKYQHEDHRILVVDDSNLIRNLLRVVLAPHYTVVEAESGDQALEMMNSTVPDLVITDLIMPGIDGYQLVRQIRETTDIAHVPVIMLTNVNTEFNRLEAYRAGVDDYMIKPFTKELMLVRIANLINNRSLVVNQALYHGDGTDGKRFIVRDGAGFKSRLNYYIEQELPNPGLKVKHLADALAMSVSTFERRVKEQCNTTPKLYIRDYRLDRAMALLKRRADNVSGIARICGFDNISYFSLCFRQKFNTSPSHILNSSEELTANAV